MVTMAALERRTPNDRVMNERAIDGTRASRVNRCQ